VGFCRISSQAESRPKPRRNARASREPHLCSPRTRAEHHSRQRRRGARFNQPHPLASRFIPSAPFPSFEKGLIKKAAPLFPRHSS
jgi:hypothetical protein